MASTIPLTAKSSGKDKEKDKERDKIATATLTKNNSSLLLSIKKRLAWNLCADLLYPPICAIGALKYDDDDSGEGSCTRYWQEALN